MKKTINIIGRVLSGLLLAVLILIFVSVIWQKLSGEVPGLFGYHLMYVLTGSMSPEIEAGDAVLVKSTDAEKIHEGDVICYYGTSGEMAGRMITHKVIRAPYEKDGERFLQTKGVANEVADEPIPTNRVFGKVILRLRLMGKIYHFFCTVPGLIAALTPIIIMIALEMRPLVFRNNEDEAQTVGATGENTENGSKQKIRSLHDDAGNGKQ